MSAVGVVLGFVVGAVLGHRAGLYMQAEITQQDADRFWGRCEVEDEPEPLELEWPTLDGEAPPSSWPTAQPLEEV